MQLASRPSFYTGNYKPPSVLWRQTRYRPVFIRIKCRRMGKKCPPNIHKCTGLSKESKRGKGIFYTLTPRRECKPIPVFSFKLKRALPLVWNETFHTVWETGGFSTFTGKFGLELSFRITTPETSCHWQTSRNFFLFLWGEGQRAGIQIDCIGLGFALFGCPRSPPKPAAASEKAKCSWLSLPSSVGLLPQHHSTPLQTSWQHLHHSTAPPALTPVPVPRPCLSTLLCAFRTDPSKLLNTALCCLQG